VVIVLIEIKKKGNERLDVMIRRFNREVQQSGVLTIAKEKRFFEKPANRRKIKESALRRNKIQAIKRGY